jgi:hypothetical protein
LLRRRREPRRSSRGSLLRKRPSAKELPRRSVELRRRNAEKRNQSA